MKKREAWRSYEDAVRAIIDKHKDLFGLEEVRSSPGKALGQSGYLWNIEVIGYTKRDRKVVLFECRRKTSRNIEPEEAGGFAYRIEDIGAEKGYFVTPINKGLSLGSQKIAAYEKINHISVSVDANPEQYLMGYLNQIFLQVKPEQIKVDEVAKVEISPPSENSVN